MVSQAQTSQKTPSTRWPVLCGLLARRPSGCRPSARRILGDSRPASQFGVRRRCAAEQGFTLLELMIVMAVIAVLAAIAIPSFVRNIKAAKEAALRTDLQTMRGAIDSYTYDKEKAPQTGDDLVQSGYLKIMPIDPMTHRADTWIFDQGTSLTSVNETEGGIDNVHSGSQEVSTDGTSYNTW